jgi:hypothetical protein
VPLSESDLSMRAKSMDYIVRSLVSGLLAVGLVGALVYCAVKGLDITGQTGAALLTATGTVIGYFFGNHAAVNGSMLTSSANRRVADATAEANKAIMAANLQTLNAVKDAANTEVELAREIAPTP